MLLTLFSKVSVWYMNRMEHNETGQDRTGQNKTKIIICIAFDRTRTRWNKI